jgi:excisionase family DNA binding protein
MASKSYTTEEVANKLGVKRTTIQGWIKRGKVAAPRIAVRDGEPPVRLWAASDVAKLEAVKKQIKTGRPKKKA